MRSLLLIILLVVTGLALLYAYRSQSPSVQTIAQPQANQQLNTGHVRKVTVTGNRAVMEMTNGEKQQTILQQPPAAFEKALADYSAANPSRTVVVEYQSDSFGFTVIPSILVSFLPVLLLGGFFVYLASRFRSR